MKVEGECEHRCTKSTKESKTDCKRVWISVVSSILMHHTFFLLELV